MKQKLLNLAENEYFYVIQQILIYLTSININIFIYYITLAIVIFKQSLVLFIDLNTIK